MHSVKILGAAALLLAFGAAQAQETTYTFQSQPFEDVSGSYTIGQTLSGSITLSEPVPPGTSMNVTPILVGYSFTDGVVTLDDTNSEIIADITLTTDAIGSIESYAMTFWESPLATSVNQVFTGMGINFSSGAGSPGCTPSISCQGAVLQINSGELECTRTSTSGGVCESAAPMAGDDWGLIFRVAEETGFDPDFDDSIWTGGPPSRPIPALGTGALVLLMLTLAALGAGVLRWRAV